MRQIPFRKLFTGLLCIAFMGGCTQDEETQPPDTTQSGPPPEAADIAQVTPALPAGLQPGWNNIVPEGAAMCSQGDEYSFWVRPGSSENLLVVLEGGGACWTGQLCSLDEQPSPYAPFAGENDNPGSRAGIFDLENPENPVAEFSMVYLSTCNGDVYLGDSEKTYEWENMEGEERSETIHHRGYQNTMASLDWMFQSLPEPEVVFVAGWSAGAIPSPIYTSIIADQYPDARIAHFADGAGAYWAQEKLAPMFESWGTLSVLDKVGGYEEFTTDTLTFEDIYIVESRKHPEITFHQYNTNEDHIAYRFLRLMGIADTPLPELRNSAHEHVRNGTDNFRTYTAWGDSENIIGGYFDGILARGNENSGRPFALDRFYTYQVDGVRFRDWFADIAEGNPVENVHCTNCETPEYSWERPE